MLKKLSLLFCAIVGAMALLLSIVLLTIPNAKPKPAQEPSTTFLLTESDGTLALIDTQDNSEVARYAVFSALLPETDVLALRKGIPVHSQQELQRLLEDFGA